MGVHGEVQPAVQGRFERVRSGPSLWPRRLQPRLRFVGTVLSPRLVAEDPDHGQRLGDGRTVGPMADPGPRTLLNPSSVSFQGVLFQNRVLSQSSPRTLSEMKRIAPRSAVAPGRRGGQNAGM